MRFSPRRSHPMAHELHHAHWIARSRCGMHSTQHLSRIAAAGEDKVIYMFNAHDGTPALKPLFAHNLGIKSVAFSLDGRYLASGGVGNICLWDATSGKLLLGPRHIFSASDNNTIRMWDVGDGTLTPIGLVGRHKDKVNSVAFSPNGKRFVLGCGDGKICMWDSKTLLLVFDPFGSHKHTKPITSVTFSPDGRLVASASNDGNICIFDLHSGDLVLGPLKAHQTLVQLVVFSPNSYYVVSGLVDGSVQVWRVADGAPACEPLEGHQHRVDLVVYSSDGAPGIVGTPGPLKLDPLMPDLRERHRAIAGGLTIDGDGWARGCNLQLLFWVPTNLLKLFPALENVYTIGPEGILHTDYSQPLLLGEEWHGCYVG
ncbi:WD40 domain-containing protein [Rhizoctonia solani AG-1 IA]|uniref:WD40 domain-containing protein n=1 Tax=Thanatephorus cucumeris (strain AG1-IA) TaxID=983506 RepID=L8WL02_THACA|nr:WD40 domain-containing protein [Rhizoctonia solani AG-1 IA]